MFAAPAGAAVGCASAGEFPNTFASQSGLKVACNSAAGDNVTNLTIHDATNVDWHHGTARTFTLAGTLATGTTTSPDVTILDSGGEITAADVNRPISGYDGTNTEVFPGGEFIKGIADGTHFTPSQGITTTITGPITTTVEYTHNRWLTDAFCHANNPGNVIVRDLDTVASGPAMTPTGGSATLAVTAANYPSTPTFTVSAVTVQIPSAGQISINTTGTTGVLHYTAFNGTTFTIDAYVSGSGTPTGATPVTWKQSLVSEFGNGGIIYKNLSPKLPTVTAGLPGNITVATTTVGTNQTYTYVGSGTSPNRITGVNDPSGSNVIVPGAQTNWTLARVSAITTLTIAPNTTANGVSPMADFITAGTGNVKIEDSAGMSTETLNWTSTSGNTFTGTLGSMVTGANAATATIKQGYRLTGTAASANNTLNSASANFTSADIGKSVSGGPFGAGVYISALGSPSANQVVLSTQDGSDPIPADCTKTNGGNLNSAHIIVPQDSSSAGTDNIEIGSDTYDTSAPHAPELFSGSDPMAVELNNSVPGTSGFQSFTCSGSVLTLTAEGKADYAGASGNAITGEEVGLPISITDIAGTTTTGTVTAASAAGNGSVTSSAGCPSGSVTSDASHSAHAYIGGPSAGGAGDGDAVMTLGAELNLSPTLVAAQDDCEPAGDHARDTFEGFEVVGQWTPPGPTYTASAVAPIVTTAQILFPTSVLSFTGYVQPQASGADGSQGSRAHYNFNFTALPTSLAVCLNDTPVNGGTPWNGTQLAFGMNATTLSHAPFLPTGSGNTGDPTVRRLLPVTTANASAQGFGTAFHQIINLRNGASDISGSPVTGPDCTISAPTVLPAISPTTCGDG